MNIAPLYNALRVGSKPYQQSQGVTMDKPIAILAYLKTQLGFTLGEWNKLPEKDKADLRQYAAEEMDALGIAHS